LRLGVSPFFLTPAPLKPPRQPRKKYSKMEELRLFLSHPAVQIVRMSEITSDRYSRIASQLKKQGTPVASNDIWIAAQTMETGAELVTLDNHLERIPGLVYCLFQLPG
jgi:tRNA(fMet)-specific endonuclease VapC